MFKAQSAKRALMFIPVFSINWSLKILYKMFQNALNRHWGYVYFTFIYFMFHFSKWLIFNYFITKYETWKINQKFWKRMDISETNCSLKVASLWRNFVILLMALSFEYCFFITSKLFIFHDIRKSKLFLCDKLSLKLEIRNLSYLWSIKVKSLF